MGLFVNLSEGQARLVAAQVFFEVSDGDFEMLFMRIVRENKHRQGVDYEKLIAKASKTWDVENSKPAEKNKRVASDDISW